MSLYDLAAMTLTDLGDWLEAHDGEPDEEWCYEVLRFDRLLWFLGGLPWASVAKTPEQAKAKYVEDEEE